MFPIPLVSIVFSKSTFLFPVGSGSEYFRLPTDVHPLAIYIGIHIGISTLGANLDRKSQQRWLQSIGHEGMDRNDYVTVSDKEVEGWASSRALGEDCLFSEDGDTRTYSLFLFLILFAVHHPATMKGASSRLKATLRLAEHRH